MELKKEIKQAYKELSNFFKIKLPIRVFIVSNIINLNYKQKRKWFGVGFFRKNTVVVIHKKLFPKLRHKKEEFKGVVMHEMAHIFIKETIKKNIPIWIEEGVAQWLSFPKVSKKKIKKISLKKLKTLEDWYKYDTPFIYCSNFFHYLENKYGREKIYKFLVALNKKNMSKAFRDVFKIKLEDCEKEYRKNEKIV